MQHVLPLFYFKPTICWIDDDELFLRTAAFSLGSDYECLTFDNPNKAIQYFKNYQSYLSSVSFMRELVESDSFGGARNCPVDVNIGQIKNLETMHDKLHEITVAVIDYNMHGMNGLELCKLLKTYPCKKILLTGDATHYEAVKAFNEGLIDQFIRKDDKTADILKATIDQLTQHYFHDASKVIIANMEASKSSVVTDPVFVDFFNVWCRENRIEEYYLINRQGSFLVKNNEGMFAHFVVMSEQDNAEFIALHDEAIDEVGSLLSQVEKGLLIPFFGESQDSWTVDLSDWDKYFYPAQTLKGKQNYYWTVVSI